MSDRAVKAVLFDYGGVLRREDPVDFDEFARGHGLAPGRLWAAFHDIPEYLLSRRGEIDAAAYREAVEADIARDIGRARAAALLAEWDASRRQDVYLEPAMETILLRLKGRVRLGLLSNAGIGASERLAEIGVSSYFDDVVCSGDVGLAKPYPEIFELAASRLGVSPTECAFIDDQERHVEGARSTGMRAHHHHRTRMAELTRFLIEVGALPSSPAAG